MTAQHKKLFDDKRGHGVITDYRKRTIATANDPQDARRLVACWNVCQGIATEALERLVTVDRSRVDKTNAAIQKATNKEQP